jgi:hypothetical protein
MTVLSPSPSPQLVAYALLLNEWFDYQDCGYDLNTVIFVYIFYLSLLLFCFFISFSANTISTALPCYSISQSGS